MAQQSGGASLQRARSEDQTRTVELASGGEDRSSIAHTDRCQLPPVWASAGSHPYRRGNEPDRVPCRFARVLAARKQRVGGNGSCPIRAAERTRVSGKPKSDSAKTPSLPGLMRTGPLFRQFEQSRWC